MATAQALEDLIDLTRYPVHDVTAPRAHAVVDQARAQLTSTGAVELPGFVNRAGVDALAADAESLAPSEPITPRGREPPTWSTRTSASPMAILASRGATRGGAVAYDLMPADSCSGGSTNGHHCWAWWRPSSIGDPCIGMPIRSAPQSGGDG